MASGGRAAAAALLLLALGSAKARDDAAPAAGTLSGAIGARGTPSDPAFRETEERVVGETDGNVTLRCWNASQQAAKVEWFHGNPGVVPVLFSSDGKLPSDARLSLVGNGALQISALRLQDEGHYTCWEEWNGTSHQHKIQLLVASGPSMVNVNISPTTALPNGTLYAKKHDALNFTCSSHAHPVPTIEWDFLQTSLEKELFTEDNGSTSYFVLHNMSPRYQGNYSCSATNVLSGRQRNITRELLIYYPPPSLPQCSAQSSVDNAGGVQLFCTWPGGYPHPTLRWTNSEDESWVVNMTRLGDTSVATLHSPQLIHGKEFVCQGSHVTEQEVNQTCSVLLEHPSVTSDPMRSCFVRGSVILSCQAPTGNPPPKITWLRNASHTQTEVQSGGRFLVSEKARISTLVIQNCSRSTDEGYYICKAENPLGLKEVYVYLTVTEPENIGGIVGAIVILCLLGIFILFGVLLYTGPRFCPKGNMLRDREANDILVLMDSEEEEPLTEPPGEPPLPRASVLANGGSDRPARNSQAEAPSEMALEEAEPETRSEA